MDALTDAIRLTACGHKEVIDTREVQLPGERPIDTLGGQ
jgi:hypothetical protein